jgi:hypothetical protein
MDRPMEDRFDLKAQGRRGYRGRGPMPALILTGVMVTFLVTWAAIMVDAIARRSPSTDWGPAIAESAILVPVLVLAALVLGRTAYYERLRRPVELRVTTDGIVIRDASGRESTTLYDSPAIDTLPWFIPPAVTDRTWRAVPGAGGMIWIPPEAMRVIRMRMEARNRGGPEPSPLTTAYRP